MLTSTLDLFCDNASAIICPDRSSSLVITFAEVFPEVVFRCAFSRLERSHLCDHIDAVLRPK